MFYAQRNIEGLLTRVEAQAQAEATETLPTDHLDLQLLFASEVMAGSLKQLQRSDLDMIRVLDD